MTGSRTWLVAAAYALAIAAIVALADTGRLEPLLRGVHALPLGDKVGHLVLMGGLAAVVNVALRARTFEIRGVRFLTGSAIVLVVVVLEELSQRFFPSRSFDLGDLAADAIGIALGGALARRVDRAMQPAPSPASEIEPTESRNAKGSAT